MNDSKDHKAAAESPLDCRVMRCFLFTYVWTGKTQQGNGNLWLCRDKFPAQKMLKEVAKNACPEEAEIVITGWNEFASVADYDAFLDEAHNAELTSQLIDCGG